MSGGRASFEVQVQSDERWTIEDVRPTEAEARTLAMALIAKKRHSAVRVVKFWRRSDGLTTETVILHESVSIGETKVTPGPIEDAPHCKKVRDYYRLESRETIGRLFRKYLEKVILTPTELIHSSKALKRVQEVDTLFPPAIDRVATLQAKEAQIDARTRRDEVYKAVTQMTVRARKTEDTPNLPSLRHNDFARLVNEANTLAPPEDGEYFALVALSRDLMEHNSWLAKLDRLAKLTMPDLPASSLALLDGVYADLFGVPTALQEILGPRDNLAEAVIAIADLCDGKLATAAPDLAEAMRLINQLVAEGRLAETRKSLLDRLRRQLAGGQPLARNEPGQESDALRKVAARLFTAEGLMGGPAMAAALTRRAVLLQEAGGKTGQRKAVETMTGLLPDSLTRIVYLSALSASDFAAEIADTITECVTREVKVGIDRLVSPRLSPTDKMRHVTRLHDEIGRAGMWAADLRRSLQSHLDGQLVGFLETRGIIEKLDDPNARLRDRAIRLLEFSAAGLLPTGGEAHRIARDRIVAILRQPNFERHIIEGITSPAEAETVLRHLHGLLARGGFRLGG